MLVVQVKRHLPLLCCCFVPVSIQFSMQLSYVFQPILLQVQPFCRIVKKTTRTVWTASAIEQGCKRCNRDVFPEVCSLHRLLGILRVNGLFT